MKTGRIIRLSLAAFILITATVYSQEKLSNEYKIGVNDILEIRVYEEPDLSKTTRVASDGTISFPLLGDIKTAGLTARELEKNLTELLARDYLVNPHVSVFVKEYAKISILGQVVKPGTYEIKGGLTLTQAISMAGGFTDIADTSKVSLIRVVAGEKETNEIDLGQILERSAPDIEINGNDTIIVSEGGQVFVVGQVTRPGAYRLKRGLTVVDVISLAGGLTQIAAPNGTKVIREENGGKKTYVVPVSSILRGGDKSKDIALKANDTIVIPESFF